MMEENNDAPVAHEESKDGNPAASVTEAGNSKKSAKKKMHHAERITSNMSREHKLMFFITIALLVLLLINTFAISSVYIKRAGEAREAIELAKPALIEVYTITDAKCASCFDINEEKARIASGNVNITKEAFFEKGSKEADEAIQRYGITRLPALIIKGQTEKVSAGSDFTAKDDALVFNGQRAPYSTLAGEVKGEVMARLITKSGCRGCFNMTAFTKSMSDAGIFFSSQKDIDADSQEGRQLISKYGIERLPFAVYSSDLSEYQDLVSSWSAFGAIVDGDFVYTNTPPPYYNVTSRQTAGLVALTMLTDSQCGSCYDVNDHLPILASMEIPISSQKAVDVRGAEGKAIAARYNITKVPTIILSRDGSYYPGLVQAWEQVGTVEKDGSFVFRGFDVWTGHTYTDLSSNTTVTG